MPRLISFIVLLAIVLLVGAIFFQVMAQFIVPLFLACVLLVVFQPLHRWLLRRIPAHPRFAALFTTILILLVVLLPLVWLGWNAYDELHSLFTPSDLAAAKTAVASNAETTANSELANSASNTTDPATQEPSEQFAAGFKNKINAIALRVRDDLKRLTHGRLEIANSDVFQIVEWAQRLITSKAISSVQTAIGILVGLAIMVIALYYFLADGPAMIETILDLSPLDSRYEQELLTRFGDVSRAVVVATLLSAVVQGALAGLGYVIALPAGAPVFLLTALTMTTALVPFVGAAAMWICVSGWVFLYGPHTVGGQIVQGDPKTAIILAIYCTIVVSGIDNVIKPFILHGQSKLHPLLALLSILGGVQVLGPVGILVGPMLVSFLQALLEMLRKELDSFGGPVVNGNPTLAVAAGATASQVSSENTGASTPLAPTATSPIAPDSSKSKSRSVVQGALGRRSKRKK